MKHSAAKTGIGEPHPDREVRSTPAASDPVAAPFPEPSAERTPVEAAAQPVEEQPQEASAAEATGAMTQDEIAALLQGHAADVIDIVAAADRRDDLNAIEIAELAGKSRKTVLEAIHDRRDSLEDISDTRAPSDLTNL